MKNRKVEVIVIMVAVVIAMMMKMEAHRIVAAETVSPRMETENQ